MKRLRTAIIGSGGIANICHVPGYLNVRDRVDVVALCDIRPEAIENTKRRFDLDVPGYADYRTMLRKEKIDVVSVCTPNTVHKTPTIAALNAKCHVLCEKPIATSARDARAMCAAAKKNRRKLMIGQSGRYHANARAVKRAVDAGQLGSIYYARAHAIRRREVPARDTFLKTALSGGGPMYDIGVHMLDLALWQMGFPKPVTASGVTARKFGHKPGVIGTWGQWDPKMFEVEDFAVAFVRFANGATLTLETSFASNIDKPVMNVWLLGTKAGADVGQGKIFTEDAGSLWNKTPYGLPPMKTYLAELEAFVTAVQKKTPVPVPGEQAVVTQTILDAVYKSAKLGREVRIR